MKNTQPKRKKEAEQKQRIKLQCDHCPFPDYHCSDGYLPDCIEGTY